MVNLLKANDYTPEELKTGFLKAIEIRNLSIQGLLVDIRKIAIQAISFEPELRKVRVKE